MFLAFINPNLVRIYGYSSRNQKDKQAYVDLLEMRLKAKHNELSDDFLKPLNLTNSDLKLGLKLPLNAYTGCLRATFNKLYDNLQGFSICATGQMLFLQLAHDLKKVPTLEIASFNTDAVSYMIDDEYKEQAHKVLRDWENLTGLELEEDNIIKIVMRDVNNYVSINQIGENDFEVHYKGGELTRGEHKFKWNKEKKTFEYSYKPSLKSNSMSIVSEAILKFLLFDIPIRETIEKCDNIFRFQIISHLGSTYEKCVQESPNGDITLNRNNRIYAGLEPSGAIIKVKPNGRRDSLANCPPNPIVDNGNECTINDINKEWYIEFAQEKANDFLGIPRLESLKKEELLEKAKELGLEIDKKTKKADLIEMIKNVERNEVRNMAEPTKQELKEKLDKALEQNERLVEKVKEMESGREMKFNDERLNDNIMIQSYLYHKINALRSYIRAYKFIYDEELPTNLGGGEYYSIGQLYNALQEGCLKVGLDFSYDVDQVISFDKELVKPSGKLPIHVATVRTKAVLTDTDTGISKEYFTIAQGSDTIDKAISGASTLAFRQWFTKNFSPKDANDENDIPNETPKSEEPKTPVYIPETKKEEIKKEVVQQVQTEESDDEDIKQIVNNIMKVRELSGDENYGAPILQMFTSGVEVDSATILEIDLKVKNKLEKVGNNG
jgi:hypothetical protein